jgi:hypothetical protein
MWGTVRDGWASVFAQKKDLSIKPKVDNKRLYEHLFAMNPAEAKSEEIKKLISSFVVE